MGRFRSDAALRRHNVKFRLPKPHDGRILSKNGRSRMKNRLACAAVVAAIVCTTSASAQTVPATWEVKKLVPGSAFHGVHGLGVDKAGHLFAGSVAGAMLYEVDIAGGTAKVAIPAP